MGLVGALKRRQKAPPGANGSGFRILVVDDEPHICQYFKDLFARVPRPRVEVTTETAPRAARNLLKKGRFDLLLTDHRMPELTGLELLQHARSQQPQMRRVLMTGFNEIPASREAIRDADIDALIQKPLNSEDIVRIVRDLLEGGRKARETWRARARELESLATPESAV